MLDLRKLLEDPFAVRRSNPDAGIPDTEQKALVFAGLRPARRPLAWREQAGAHAYLAVLGELERVADEVAQDLRDLRLVGIEPRQRIRGFEEQLDPARTDRGAQHAAQC